MRQDRFGGPLEDFEGVGIRGKFMSVDEPTAGFVEGVTGQAIVDVELSGGLDGLAKSAHEAVDLGLRFFRSGHGVSASQAGNVLTKRMPGDECVKIVFFVEVVSIVIPAAHVGAWSRHSLALAEGLEQAIFVEIKEQFVILIELRAERTG